MVAFIFVHIPELSTLWLNRHPFPPMSLTTTTLSTLLLYTGIVSYMRIRRSSESESRSSFRAKSWLYTLLVLCFGLAMILSISRRNEVSYHPIDLLIFNAKSEHEKWLGQATMSRSLEAAVEQYKKRYNQHPPPYVLSTDPSLHLFICAPG